jgi:hypothetical protein
MHRTRDKKHKHDEIAQQDGAIPPGVIGQSSAVEWQLHVVCL